MPTKPLPIAERVRNAFPASKHSIQYVALERAVFPDEQFPRAFRRSCNGGPPGCRWMFKGWLAKNGYHIICAGTDRGVGAEQVVRR